MNIGELTLLIGVKGTDKTVGALTGVKNSMGDVASMSLEAKASILAAVYALERLMSSSSQAGTNLENFNALTGISTRTLQEYQFAGRQVGIANEEMTSSFKGVQNAMTNMRLGKGAPEGLGQLSGKVGFDANRAKSDTAYVMKKLQEYANAEHEVGMRNFVLKSFGVGETVMAGMARNAFKPGTMKNAPTYNEKEISNLDKANAAWSNLGTKIEMAIGHLNAAHGGQLVKDISNITDKLLILINTFVKLANQVKLFEGISKVFEGWSSILGGIGTGVESITNAASGKDPKAREKLADNVTGFFKDIPSVLGSMVSDILPSKSKENEKLGTKSDKAPKGSLPQGPLPAAKVQLTPPTNPITPGAIAPPVGQGSQQNSTQNNNVNQTFHFTNDGSNPQQIGDATQKAVTKAFFQIPQGGF